MHICKMMLPILFIFLIKFKQISSGKDILYEPSAPPAPGAENLHDQASTSNNENFDEIYHAILAQLVEKPALLHLFEQFFNKHDALNEQNAKLKGEKIYWQTHYWTLWCHNYATTKLISANHRDGILYLQNGTVKMDEDFMLFVLHGRTPDCAVSTIHLALLEDQPRFKTYYFDELLTRIAVTELPHLVMNLHVKLPPDGFKCPDACYILSGFVDTLSFHELFPYCTDTQFVHRARRAHIKAIGHNQAAAFSHKNAKDADQADKRRDNNGDNPRQKGHEEAADQDGGDPWNGFLLEHPDGVQFELRLHYSPVAEQNWTKLVIRQLAATNKDAQAKDEAD